MEASPEQAEEGLALVRVLSAVLDRLVAANSPVALADPGQVTKFHAMKAPGIGIEPYLERIHKYASCSNECFILALIYIDRLIQRSNFLLTDLNVHRVVVTSVLLAAKFFDDAYYNNAYYAKVGGVLVSEMNGLEVDFLFRINFSLHVTPEIFDKYRAELVLHSTTCSSVVSSPGLLPSVSEAPSPVMVAQPPATVSAGPFHFDPVVPVPATTTSAAAPVPVGQLLPMVTTHHYQHRPELVSSAATSTSSCSRITPTSSVENCPMDTTTGTVTPAAMPDPGQYFSDSLVPLQQPANSLSMVLPTKPSSAPPFHYPLGPAPMFVAQAPAHQQQQQQQQQQQIPSFPSGAGTDDSFFVAAALENQLFPLQTGNLVHHVHQHHHNLHHGGVGGGGFQRPASDGATYNSVSVGRMLTGMSGAGL